MWFLRRLVQLFRLDQVRPVRSSRRVGPVRRDRLAAYNTYDARSFFSQLLARTAGGEEIVIARSGIPLAKLVPYSGEPLRPGLVRTHVIVIPEERDDAGRQDSG
jgi:antitoxin (DNA-binding transcriptional repressor) of toxin-antitoxin stability system